MRQRTLINTLVIALGTSLVVLAPAAAARAAGAEGSTFTPIAPVRILDTWLGWGAPDAPVLPHHTIHLKVAGRHGINGAAGVPATGADAVVLRVAVVEPGSSGFITAYPTGTPRPTTSILDFMPGFSGQADVAAANTAVVALGDGKVDLYNGSSDTVQLSADVDGYFTPGSTAAPGAFTSVTPTRVLDTRAGLGAPEASVPAHGTVRLDVTGRGGIPATGVGAVAITITATGSSAAGHVTAFADGTSRPPTTDLSFTPGRTDANLLMARLGSNGHLDLYNASSQRVHLIGDVAGYYSAGTATSGGALTPVAPARVLDTRSGVGARRGALQPSESLTLQVTGRRGIPATGVGAATLNFTVTQGADEGFLDVYSDADTFLPSVNYRTGQNMTSLVVTRLTSSGAVTVVNKSSQAVQVIADVTGYYLTP